MAALPSFPEHAAQHILQIAADAVANVSDAVLAGQLLRSRIAERTARGVDARGASFVPYSEAYAKEKAVRLGSADTVDLFGYVHHPHMMNAMVVRVNGSEMGASPLSLFGMPVFQGFGGSVNRTPAQMLEVGFYGEEATRARVHNEGAEVRTRLGSGKSKKQKKDGKSSFNMPMRHFFDANEEDIRLMELAIGNNINARLKGRP